MFDGFLLTRTAVQRTSSNGSKFLDMTLSDVSGEFNAKMWDGTVQPPVAGSIVKVRAAGNEFNGRMQLRVEKIRAAEEKLANAEKDLADSKQSVGELAQTVNALTGEVSQKVSQTDYNVLADRVTSNETSISQNAKKIESKASSESVEILRGTVTGLETTVTQQAAQIELKAEREDVDTLNDKVTDNEAAIRLRQLPLALSRRLRS